MKIKLADNSTYLLNNIRISENWEFEWIKTKNLPHGLNLSSEKKQKHPTT
jgi:hypothetical protein